MPQSTLNPIRLSLSDAREVLDGAVHLELGRPILLRLVHNFTELDAMTPDELVQTATVFLEVFRSLHFK